MKKLSLFLSILLISILASCSYHPDYSIGSSSDYETIHNWGSIGNPLYKGKGFYDVGYCRTGVYKEYNSSCTFKIMEDGELYFDKHTYKSGLITVEGVGYNSYGPGTHVTVKKGDEARVVIKMEPYFTTRKNELFYEFTIYLK